MIISCGEALIDMLPRTTPQGEAAFAPYAGGAVFNTAIALGRLGVMAGFFSGISNDMLGEILIQSLEQSKVDHSFTARSNRPTTVAFIKLVDGQATYAFYDENTAGRLLNGDDLPLLDDNVSTLFFGGISLVNDPAASTYEALQAREADRRVTMIDPNIRPSFITDQTNYRARIERMISRADIVKMSDEDLHWLLGEGDLENLGRSILDKGPKLVLITQGALGARALMRDHNRFYKAPLAIVADTVGAGDTFNAGVLAALDHLGHRTKGAIARLTESDLDAALSLATRAAAITVARAGANPPWADEL